MNNFNFFIIYMAFLWVTWVILTGKLHQTIWQETKGTQTLKTWGNEQMRDRWYSRWNTSGRGRTIRQGGKTQEAKQDRKQTIKIKQETEIYTIHRIIHSQNRINRNINNPQNDTKSIYKTGNRNRNIQTGNRNIHNHNTLLIDHKLTPCTGGAGSWIPGFQHIGFINFATSPLLLAVFFLLRWCVFLILVNFFLALSSGKV